MILFSCNQKLLSCARDGRKPARHPSPDPPVQFPPRSTWTSVPSCQPCLPKTTRSKSTCQLIVEKNWIIILPYLTLFANHNLLVKVKWTPETIQLNISPPPGWKLNGIGTYWYVGVLNDLFTSSCT